jgi:hypothetical protein
MSGDIKRWEIWLAIILISPIAVYLLLRDIIFGESEEP